MKNRTSRFSLLLKHAASWLAILLFFGVVHAAETIITSSAVKVNLSLIEVKSLSDAEKILSNLKNGVSFEQLAREYSIGPNSVKGGNIGELRFEDINPDFKKALGGLRKGEYSDIISTGATFKILYIVDLIPETVQTLPPSYTPELVSSLPSSDLPVPDAEALTIFEQIVVSAQGEVATRKVKATVAMPHEVKAKWNAVRLSVNDMVQGIKKEYVVEVGKNLKIPDSELKVAVITFLPDFYFDQKKIIVTTKSDKPDNPAAEIAVEEGGKEIFKGWLYAKFPAIRPFQHKRFEITLMHGIAQDYGQGYDTKSSTSSPEIDTISLLSAVLMGNAEIVRTLLEKGANANEQDDNGATPLMIATQEGHAEVVRVLIAKGANVNAKYKDGTTALIAAANEGHEDIVRALLERGANVNAKKDGGITALMLATIGGHTAVARLLLKKGAGVDIRCDVGMLSMTDNGSMEIISPPGATALIAAAARGYLDIVHVLLERGANVNAKDNNGQTVLMHATANGHLKIVRVLLEKGAIVSAKDKEGRTALTIATDKGNDDIVRILKNARTRNVKSTPVRPQ